MFEQKIMNVCEVVIFLTLVVTAVIVFVQIYGTHSSLRSLSLVSAAVLVHLVLFSVALPISHVVEESARVK